MTHVLPARTSGCSSSTGRRRLDRIAIVVMAKAPVPGEVKTRLTPAVSGYAAARLAVAALLDTLDAVEGLVDGRSRPQQSGQPANPMVRGVLALAGDLENAVGGNHLHTRLAARWQVIDQRGAGFAERLVAAHLDAAGAGASFQIGMDTPQITADLLCHGIDTLGGPDIDAVLGPAADGGWWALGLRDARQAGVLRTVPMSTAHTCQDTLDALRGAGMRVGLLPELIDVDTLADAELVAGSAPNGRFARAFRQLDVRADTA